MDFFFNTVTERRRDYFLPAGSKNMEAAALLDSTGAGSLDRGSDVRAATAAGTGALLIVGYGPLVATCEVASGGAGTICLGACTGVGCII